MFILIDLFSEWWWQCADAGRSTKLAEVRASARGHQEEAAGVRVSVARHQRMSALRRRGAQQPRPIRSCSSGAAPLQAEVPRSPASDTRRRAKLRAAAVLSRRVQRRSIFTHTYTYIHICAYLHKYMYIYSHIYISPPPRFVTFDFSDFLGKFRKHILMFFGTFSKLITFFR